MFRLPSFSKFDSFKATMTTNERLTSHITVHEVLNKYGSYMVLSHLTELKNSMFDHHTKNKEEIENHWHKGRFYETRWTF